MADKKEPTRPMGKSTLLLERKKLEAEVALRAKEFELKAKTLDLADRDKERDDRRALVRTILAWSMTVAALALIGGALYWKRDFVFKGFGIEATTGSEVPEEVLPEEEDPAPVLAPAPLPVPSPSPSPRPAPVRTESASAAPVPGEPAPIVVSPETLDRLIEIFGPEPEPVPDPVPAPDPAPVSQPVPELELVADDPPAPEPEPVPEPDPEPTTAPE